MIPSLQNYPQLIVIHTVKGLGLVNKAEVDVFLELSYFSNDPTDVGNFISASSAFPRRKVQLEHLEVHGVQEQEYLALSNYSSI